MGSEMLARAWGTSAGRQDALVRFERPRRLSPGGQWTDMCSWQKGRFVREDTSDLCLGNCEPKAEAACKALQAAGCWRWWGPAEAQTRWAQPLESHVWFLINLHIRPPCDPAVLLYPK